MMPLAGSMNFMMLQTLVEVSSFMHVVKNFDHAYPSKTFCIRLGLLLTERWDTENLFIIVYSYIIYMCVCVYKLYHTTSRISLLLHNAEAKLRQSANNNDIPSVVCYNLLVSQLLMPHKAIHMHGAYLLFTDIDLCVNN